MGRTPPNNTKAYVARLIWVFEKHQGTISATFNGRLISRASYRSVARYDGLLWRIYPPEAFPEMRQQWIKPGDTVYLDSNPLKLPLEHPFMFECDKPLGPY